MASGELLDDAKGVYGAFMETDAGKAVQNTWNKYFAVPPKSAEGGAYGAYSAANPPTFSSSVNPNDNAVTPSTEGEVLPSGAVTPSTDSAALPGAVPTYEQWKAQGGASAGAYQSYLNSVKSAEEELERQKNAARTNYELARSTYGAEGEALRSAGLTGGYSDYLDSKAYALSQSNIASAERTAAEAKRAAESELYAKYEGLDNKYKAISEGLYDMDATELYALRNSADITGEEYKALVSDWVDYQSKKGNTDVLEEYKKLSGDEAAFKTGNTSLDDKINEAQGVADNDVIDKIDISTAPASDPVSFLSNIPVAKKDEVAVKMAERFLNNGDAVKKTYVGNNDKKKTRVNHVSEFDEGEWITLWTNNHKAYTSIKEVYDKGSDMERILNAIEGNANNSAAIVILNGVVYARTNTKNGTAWKWVKTGIDQDGIGEF